METRELFIIAVKNEMKQNSITQSKLADKLHITRPAMSSFLKMKPGGNFSEERKQKISEYFGKSYFEMLKEGEEILSGDQFDSDEKREIEDAASRIVSESLIESNLVVSEKVRLKIVKIAQKEIEEKMIAAKSKAKQTVELVLDAINDKD